MKMASSWKSKDEGPGIAFTEQEKVFDKFYRLDNEVNRKNPGTGLGLPICRALVNLHGGQDLGGKRSEQGCRFIFTLPLESGQAGYEGRHGLRQAVL